MMKPKRITRKQYRTLAQLKMPVLGITGYDLEASDAIKLLLDSDFQEYQHQDLAYLVLEGHTFYTLVDSDEED